VTASGDWTRMQARTRAGNGERVSEEALLASLQRDPAWFEARARVRAWTRARFDLAAHAAVDADEMASEMPGCPPLETRVEFWSADGTRHHFKVFKPMAEVAEEDIPPAWLREALAVPEGYACDCC
jgi:hypothetical protein